MPEVEVDKEEVLRTEAVDVPEVGKVEEALCSDILAE